MGGKLLLNFGTNKIFAVIYIIIQQVKLQKPKGLGNYRSYSVIRRTRL